MADKRITPFRADLAAAHLQGVIDAPHYVTGVRRSVGVGRTALRAGPAADAAQDSELLFGEIFTVYDHANGWSWGQLERDGYVGYVQSGALCDPFVVSQRVTALMAPVFPGPGLKGAVRDLLPLNASVNVLGHSGDYVQIAPGQFLHRRHLEPFSTNDFVTVAQGFAGVPYVWGGKTWAGLDCSGLIQTALHAVARDCPRDADMQEQKLGHAIARAERRGDLVFWKGHVGVMIDETHLLHANAFHMAVRSEPLAQAIARIERVAGPVTSVRRL